MYFQNVIFIFKVIKTKVTYKNPQQPLKIATKISLIILVYYSYASLSMVRQG